MLLSLLLACTAESITLPDSEGDLILQAYPSDVEGAKYFSQFTTVFGVYILATDGVADDKLTHAAHVMARYLDGDEDGVPEAPEVVETMVERQATLMMFASQREALWSGVFRSDALDEIHGQDLYDDETNEPGRFDASLEEVLHLITSAGWAHTWPAELGEEDGTELAEAMDIARGGHFTDIPDPYPSESWYHYDDATCEYDCMVTEYVYWALTSLLGAQSGRCEEIEEEWELCTAAQVEAGDAAVTALLTDGRFPLPTVLPDGSYAGQP